MKKYTSTANDFLFHKCRNNRKIQKCKTNAHLKIFTSSANELNIEINVEIIRNCGNVKKFNLQKKYTSQLMSFSYILKAIGNSKSKKKLQVQFMSYYYIIVETIGKWKEVDFFLNMKKIYKSS